jgi:hypothetical protein
MSFFIGPLPERYCSGDAGAVKVAPPSLLLLYKNVMG